jgi:hypothetical protein
VDCTSIEWKALNGPLADDYFMVDAEIKARLAELAYQAGQGVDQFAEALLRQVGHHCPAFRVTTAGVSSTTGCSTDEGRGDRFATCWALHEETEARWPRLIVRLRRFAEET